MYITQEIYTYKCTLSNWFGNTYTLYFDETPIREITNMDARSMQDTVDLLNTAYSLGLQQGELYAQFNNKGE